jgi:hypothetical protein
MGVRHLRHNWPPGDRPVPASLASDRAHHAHYRAGPPSMEVERERRLLHQIRVPNHLPWLCHLRFLETNLEVFGVAACALLLVVGQSGALLDSRSSGSMSITAPSEMPAMRSCARDDPPPTPRVPVLVTGLARDPLVAALLMPAAGQ